MFRILKCWPKLQSGALSLEATLDGLLETMFMAALFEGRRYEGPTGCAWFKCSSDVRSFDWSDASLVGSTIWTCSTIISKGKSIENETLQNSYGVRFACCSS